MKLKPPSAFTFEAGPRAVLLLHGFSGTTADVRMLGRFLEKHGYTVHAPLYRGHGVPPEELVRFSPHDWWEDVLDGYDHLKTLGYDEIAVAGLSLGGVFSLKLGYTEQIKGIIPICAPMTIKSKERLAQGVLDYAKRYKEQEQKAEAVIEQEMQAFESVPKDKIYEVQSLIASVRDHLDMIYTPTFVIQATHDEIVNPVSATLIYDEVEADLKHLKWYDHSSHVITLDKEKELVHADVLTFLEQLDWEM